MLRVELRLQSRLGRGLPSSPHPRVGMVALAFLVCVASVYQVGKRSDVSRALLLNVLSGQCVSVTTVLIDHQHRILRQVIAGETFDRSQ